MTKVYKSNNASALRNTSLNSDTLMVSINIYAVSFNKMIPEAALGIL